jgi:hypothetical protein
MRTQNPDAIPVSEHGASAIIQADLLGCAPVGVVLEPLDRPQEELVAGACVQVRHERKA